MSTHLFVAEWNRMSLTPEVGDVGVDTKRVLVVIFGTVAVLAGSRIAYKYIARRRRRARDDGVKRQLAAGRRERDVSEAQLCVVCVVCAENPRKIILLPCGHVCLCEDCSDNITDHCPICRQRIEFRAPAFIA